MLETPRFGHYQVVKATPGQMARYARNKKTQQIPMAYVELVQLDKRTSAWGIALGKKDAAELTLQQRRRTEEIRDQMKDTEDRFFARIRNAMPPQGFMMVDPNRLVTDRNTTLGKFLGQVQQVARDWAEAFPKGEGRQFDFEMPWWKEFVAGKLGTDWEQAPTLYKPDNRNAAVYTDHAIAV